MQGPSILIVEDDRIVAQDLRMRLTGLGYPEPGLAATGEAAIIHAKSKHLDLILMDIVFAKGHLDGVQTVEEIRAFAVLSVIYITASTDEATLERAIATRPSAIIRKPVETHELAQRIQAALSRKGRP